MEMLIVILTLKVVSSFSYGNDFAAALHQIALYYHIIHVFLLVIKQLFILIQNQMQKQAR